MVESMSRPDLTPVSYVVLGLIARDGPSTPYALKAAVGRGIAHFWQFPHSQIYAETERLAGLGLLAEEREHTGRRRRSYRITPEGRAALSAWLAEPAAEAPPLRSPGLLQVFVAPPPGPRRRTSRPTPGARPALSAWLAEPAAEPPQLRSLGLLKLFFAQHAGPGDIAELAKVQAELHRQTVDYTREIIARLQARGDLPGQLAVAELMGDALR